jgi:hypothetical protein
LGCASWIIKDALLSKTAGAVRDRSNKVPFGLIPETDPAQTASMEEFVTELDQVRRIRQTQGTFPVSIDGVFKP